MEILTHSVPAIWLDDLGIYFRVPKEGGAAGSDRKRGPFDRQRMTFQKMWALHHISFSVEKGSSIGVMGRNGAGKSTLLKAIARVLAPREGRIVVVGNVFPLLELGAGFLEELTGQENVYLYGNLLRLTNPQITALYDSILDFSEIGEFIHAPLRSYSSGMKARLAFAVATAVQPDILLADEILSVGDTDFQAKCIKRMNYYMTHGTTIVFVSHNPEHIRQVCRQALWLEHGEMKLSGSAEEVADAYSADCEGVSIH